MLRDTTVEYNGVRIEQCHTRRFEQEPVYEHGDLLYSKFTIRVGGLIHGNTGQLQWFSPTQGDGAARDFTAIRSMLTEPRGEFEMKVGDNVLLRCQRVRDSNEARGDLSFRDVRNGPRCTFISITHFAAGVLKVEVEFEICAVECNRDGSAGSSLRSVLSNKWSCQDDIDQNFMTTRTFTGRLQLTSARVNPHEFRHLVVPPLQPGLRRDRMSFIATEDGLQLQYTIVDREVAFSPPEPATSWHMNYTEHTGTGFVWFGELSVSLAGDRNANKKLLIAIAATILEAKLGPFNNNQNIIEHMTITDEYGDNVNSIHLSARVKHVRDNVFNAQMAINGQRLGRPIDGADLAAVVPAYNSNFSRGNRARETIEISGPVPLASAWSAHLQSPCEATDRHRINAGVPSTVSGSSSRGGVSLSGRVVSELPAVSTNLSREHIQFPYTYWQMESKFDLRGMKVQMPIARSSSSSSDDTAKVITLAPGVAQRIVRIKGERIGDWPILPTPQDYKEPTTGIDYTLLDVKVLPGVPERTPDGKSVYRAEFEAVYAMSRPPRVDERVVIGKNPWDTLGVQTTGYNLLSGGVA